ncbi:acyl-CoA 6-desaturase-like isoform X2 [Patiria miniata]|nr:acyl-CoA 6-desaturase-like isoform X2 [Patiria miniata]XP_038071961.1 acyl-CoA 6-desaturase-like isoform X2 [Patiria miniata]
MGKGGNHTESAVAETQASNLGTIPWDEVSKHNGRAKEDPSKWLVINGQVYDVTAWTKKHPGGSRLLSHYAGQDASEPFTAFHPNMSKVQKYLKGLKVIGKAEQREERREIEEDLKNLRSTAQKMGLFEANYFFYFLMLVQVVFCDLFAYINMLYFGAGWGTFVAAALLTATAQVQAGWFQHDLGHLSVSKSRTVNRALHALLMGVSKGASGNWWNHMHYQHHAKPNVMYKDPDVRLEALFVVGENMPKKMAEKNAAKGKSSMPYNYQHRYFFIIGPPLLFPVYFQFMTFYYCVTRKEWMDLFLSATYYVRFALFYIPLLGFWKTLVLFECMRVLESMWFTWVAQSNHIPMNIEEDQGKPWLALQLSATCNIQQSWFNDWFTGHLNFQIEHHLFPTMPRHNLYRIAPMAKSLCKKHGIDYQLKTLGSAFVDIVTSLEKSGKIWFDAYYSLRHEL